MYRLIAGWNVKGRASYDSLAELMEWYHQCHMFSDREVQAWDYTTGKWEFLF
jgi:hypothetical protein